MTLKLLLPQWRTTNAEVDATADVYAVTSEAGARTWLLSGKYGCSRYVDEMLLLTSSAVCRCC
jgi:hypothetical protein